jgi:hypothetical protein
MRTNALIIEPVPKEERHLVPGPAGHMVRTDFQKEYDREYEARMYLSGLRMSDIAERLGVSVATVQRDIEEIRDEWRTARIANMDMLKNMELARLDALEQTQQGIHQRRAVPDERRLRRRDAAEPLHHPQGADREAEHRRSGRPRRRRAVHRPAHQTLGAGRADALDGLRRRWE